MQEPTWIRADVVVAIHQRQLAEHGGEQGTRDSNLLDSALAKPRNLWEYSDPRPDVASLAASYAFGIIRNHAFVDGNKRTALATCRTFLLINGYDIDVSPQEKYLAFLKLAEGSMDEGTFAEWIKAHLRESSC